MKHTILFLSSAVIFPSVVSASNYIPCSTEEASAGTCFSCGATCVARYTETINSDETVKGTLTISGEGDMSLEARYPVGSMVERKDGSTYEYTGAKYTYNQELGRYQTDAPWRDLDRNITDVVIEEGITSVAPGSFYNVTSLESVSIPQSVTKIENAAFQYATSLTNAELPENLTSLGHAAFHNTSIEYFTIPEGLQRNETGVVSDNTHMFGSRALKGIVVSSDGYFDKDMMLGANMSNLEFIYCASNAPCQSLREDDAFKDKIISYDKEGGIYVLDGVNYMSANDMFRGALANPEDRSQYACNKTLNECKRDVLEAHNICQSSTCNDLIASDGKYMLKYNGRTYQSLNDLLKGNYDVRRIYTVDEANFVSGKKNRVMLKYK